VNIPNPYTARLAACAQGDHCWHDLNILHKCCWCGHEEPGAEQRDLPQHGLAVLQMPAMPLDKLIAQLQRTQLPSAPDLLSPVVFQDLFRRLVHENRAYIVEEVVKTMQDSS
jgi:hypothetical protein